MSDWIDITTVEQHSTGHRSFEDMFSGKKKTVPIQFGMPGDSDTEIPIGACVQYADGVPCSHTQCGEIAPCHRCGRYGYRGVGYVPNWKEIK